MIEKILVAATAVVLLGFAAYGDGGRARRPLSKPIVLSQTVAHSIPGYRPVTATVVITPVGP